MMTQPTVPSETSVLIVGGGPAGLAAAIALAQLGVQATVVEAQAPGTDKACGEGLMPAALTALGALGLVLEPELGQEFTGIRFVDRHHRVQAGFTVGPGRGVRRPDLHRRLAQRAAGLGVNLCWNSRVRLLQLPSDADDGPGRATVNGQELRFRWLVGADGQASAVRRWAGLDASRSERTRFGFRHRFQVKPWSDFVEVHWAPRGQIYVTPVSPESVCVVGMTHHPHTVWNEFLAGFPDLEQRLRAAALDSRPRGAISAMRRLRRVASRHTALIGDASGSADSITGEGLAMTFQQASALAHAIAAGSLASYERQHRRIGRKPHWMGELMLTLDRWPVLLPPVLRVLERWPEIFSGLVNFHTQPHRLRPAPHSPSPSRLHGPEPQWQLDVKPGGAAIPNPPC